jgi:hypothetical protein
MKKVIVAFLSVGLILGLTQCAEKEVEDTRTLITKKIQYDVPIMNPDATHDWWVKNIEGSDREALINNIFDRVLSGEIQAYDYFNEPLTPDDVARIMSDTIAEKYQRPYPPYAEYDTTIIVNIERSDISLIRFLEEWKYDEKTLQIDKEVYGIGPVTEVYVDGISMTRLLFWIYTDEDFLGK